MLEDLGKKFDDNADSVGMSDIEKVGRFSFLFNVGVQEAFDTFTVKVHGHWHAKGPGQP